MGAKWYWSFFALGCRRGVQDLPSSARGRTKLRFAGRLVSPSSSMSTRLRTIPLTVPCATSTPGGGYSHCSTLVPRATEATFPFPSVLFFTLVLCEDSLTTSSSTVGFVARPMIPPS